MAELKEEVTFHNKLAIKVQAQIFVGHTLISTCVAEPNETQTLTATSSQYDIYCKNGSTGWALARLLNSQAKKFTLSQKMGKYIIT